MTQYERRRGHIGYTGGAFDPVFLQDKIEYLLALEKADYFNSGKKEVQNQLC
jgi:hypothetical protein